MILIYLAPSVDPAKFIWLSFISLLYIPLLILNIAALLIWLILKWRYAFFYIIILVAGFNTHQRNFALNFPSLFSKDENKLRVMSYNIRYFDLYNWTKNKESRDKMIAYIKEFNPDIVCFQEYYEEKIDRFQTTELVKKELELKYHHFEFSYKLDNEYFWGIAIFSRYPILKTVKLPFDNNRGNISTYSDLKINNDTIRFFNFHLASNYINPEAFDDVMKADENSVKEAKNLMHKLKIGYQHRSQQIAVLTEYISESPYPVVACGDLNDTPNSFYYAQLRNHLQDAFLKGGLGAGYTFNQKIPFLRIDYILHSSKIKSENFKVGKLKLSDHYPIICEMKFGE